MTPQESEIIELRERLEQLEDEQAVATRPPTEAERLAHAIRGKLAAVETEITAINEALEDQRRAVKERLAPLLAQRDHLADALKAVRANLTHLILPQTIAALGIESGAAVGTPGSGS